MARHAIENGWRRVAATLAAALLVGCAGSPTATPARSPTSAPTTEPTSPSPSPAPTSPPRPSASPSASPAPAAITARITLPSDPGAYPQTPFDDLLAVTDGAIWIVWWHTDPNRLLRIDAGSGEIGASVPLPFPVQLAAGDGGLWATGPYASAPSPEFHPLYRVDLTSAALTELAPIRWGSRGFSAGLGWLWAEGKGGVWRMRQTTGQRTALYPTPTPGSGGGIGCGSFWWFDSNGDDTELARLDLATGVFRDPVVTGFFAARPIGTADRCWLVSRSSVQPLLGTAPGAPIVDAAMYVAGRSVWALTGDVVRRIDLETGLPIDPGWRIDATLLETSEKGDALAFCDAGGFLWLLNRDQVIRFDIPTS